MKRALLVVVLGGLLLAADGRLFRTADGPLYECMAVPLAYPSFRLNELDQDAGDSRLYPTRMPRGWVPVGGVMTQSILGATATAMSGGPSIPNWPAVVMCREAGADLPDRPPAERPKPSPEHVDPGVFEESD